MGLKQAHEFMPCLMSAISACLLLICIVELYSKASGSSGQIYCAKGIEDMLTGCWHAFILLFVSDMSCCQTRVGG